MARSLDDYVDVATRIVKFHEKYPDGSLRSHILEHTDSRIVIQAEAFRSPQDEAPGVGHAAESIPGKTGFVRDSEVENCETSAWGRALAALGFEVKKGVASREEVKRVTADPPISDAGITALQGAYAASGWEPVLLVAALYAVGVTECDEDHPEATFAKLTRPQGLELHGALTQTPEKAAA